MQVWVERWMARLPLPLSDADRDGGFWWELSMRQVEVSRTLVFGGGCHARAFFENVVFKLADQRPDLLTGGARLAVGAQLMSTPAPNSQFPPGSWQAAAGTLCPGRRTARHLKHPAGPPGRPAGDA